MPLAQRRRQRSAKLDALAKDTEGVCVEEAAHREEITGDVNKADLECREVDKLRDSILEQR